MNTLSLHRRLTWSKLFPSLEPREGSELDLVALDSQVLKTPIPSKLGGGGTGQVAAAQVDCMGLIPRASFE